MRPARGRATVLACAALAATPGTAAATHWPQQGGDPGRSGYQPASDGTAPVGLLWATAGEPVATAPVITAGRLERQRVAYGTADGRVHLRELASGQPVGPAAGVALGGLAAGAFGSGPAASASFAATADRIYVLHAADNRPDPLPTGSKLDDDVMLAVIDAGSGALQSDTVVGGSAGLQVSAPAVIVSGTLLFVASGPGGAARLFARELASGRTSSVSIAGALPAAGPSVAWLAGASGAVGPYAVVGSTAGLRSFSVARFPEEGPASGPLEGAAGAVAVALGARVAHPVAPRRRH